MISGRCQDCKWYQMIDSVTGECHRHAPMVTTIERKPGNSTVLDTVWPVVTNSGWCGDYTPNDPIPTTRRA